MLSDRDREALREVERRIRNEDPRFARAFDARAKRLRRPSACGPSIKIFVVSGLLLSAFAPGRRIVGGSGHGRRATALTWLVWRSASGADETGTGGRR